MNRRIVLLTSLGLALLVLVSAPSALAQTGTLFVEGDKVGIGVATPQTDLHIQSKTSNGNVVLVQATGGHELFRVYETTAGDGLVSLRNNVGTETFRFTSVAGGRLSIGCSASLTSDLELNDGSGSGVCGSGTFSKADAGDTQFTTSSSRLIKENLEAIPADGILDRMSKVNVYSYDFIHGPKDRIGLMAEDFHTIFGRGSDKMLNGHEVQLALWLAVQQLAQRNRELESQNGELVERLDRIEQLLSSSQVAAQ